MGDEHVATPDNIKNSKNLDRIADQKTQEKDVSIGILIGGSKALQILGVIPSKDGGL